MSRHRDEIRAERRALARKHDGRFPEQAAASVEQLTENAKARAAGALVELVADSAMDGNLRLALPTDPSNPKLPQLVVMFVLSSDAFHTWLRENVMEIIAGFATEMPLSEYQRRLEELEAELAETEREDRKRPLLEQRALVDEALAQLEQD
jgi:hypothetical protein